MFKKSKGIEKTLADFKLSQDTESDINKEPYIVSKVLLIADRLICVLGSIKDVNTIHDAVLSLKKLNSNSNYKVSFDLSIIEHLEQLIE